uniref:SEC22-like protein C, vesicle trafficking protein n=1 Tax=Pipistrellus kuhlii TaxID=59472 RepID=A0A7J7WEL5_PIPKU|nr:SEC22-like protein C, vesicle trafficking protein [Pipistrellus kuhlii]
MSLILFACVVRVRDGLPLSASTDFYHTREFLEVRRRLKTLALRLAQYPGRGSARGRDFSIQGSIRKAQTQVGLAEDTYMHPTAPGLLKAKPVQTFLLQGMWPAWPSAPTGAQQPWPSASWRPCGGNSQLPMTPPALA